jgi:hypothetical protein
MISSEVNYIDVGVICRSTVGLARTAVDNNMADIVGV